jgi:hypothetical protein
MESAKTTNQQTIRLNQNITLPYDGIKWVYDSTGESVLVNFNSQTVAYKNENYSLREVNLDYIVIEKI